MAKPAASPGGAASRLRGPALRALLCGPLAALCAAQPLLAATRLVEQVRHGSSDRVIIQAPADAGLAARQDGTMLVIDLPQSARAPALINVTPAPPGQWVRDVTASGGELRLRLAPGARPRLRRLADRIIVDVDDTLHPLQPGEVRPAVLDEPHLTARVQETPARVASPGLASPGPTSPGPTSPGPASPQRPVSVPHPVQAASLPAARPLSPTQDAGATPAASVSLLPDDGTLGGPSILLPAAKQTGAAAFTRNGELHVVLDAPVLLDLSQLKDDAVFGGSSERLLPDGSELRLRPQPGAVPHLVRRDTGWQLTLAAGPAKLAPLTGQAKSGVLSLAAASPGRVIAMEDETTGSRLLVGTQRTEGQRVVAGHRSVEWIMVPSWQGVVVQPLSDRVAMVGKPAGFDVLAADPPALALVWPDRASATDADGRAMTRRFDFPSLPAPMLRLRLAEALRDAAMTPLASRAAPRLRVAAAMLACGLDSEAASVLQVAAADDPSAMHNPGWHGMAAIAAWLTAQAGGEAAPPPPFDVASIGDSDEAALWRALWSGGRPDTAGAASSAAARWRLLLAYPEALRRKMAPAVAELLARGGQDTALAELIAALPDPSLDLAQAGLLTRQGKPDASLRLLDRVAAGEDRLNRALALEVAVEQRLAARAITPAAAAASLDQQIYAWRGGERELRVRLRAAALHTQSGDWRHGLALLRETEQVFPDAHDAIHAAEVGMVSDLLHADRAAQLSALDLMALADAASSLLGAADAEAALAPYLADRLLALDLPDQAEPILHRLLDKAAGGAAEAELGLRLANLVAERGDEAAALALLDRSGNRPVPPDLAERRALLRAGLLARSGKPADALAGLAGLSDRPAVELQASIREGLHDWSGAEQALRTLVDGPAQALALPDRQALALHAARDASEAGDTAGLRSMHASYGPLFAGSANAGLFAVLTADPVQHLTDLPRAGRELAAIRALPAALTLATAK